MTSSNKKMRVRFFTILFCSLIYGPGVTAVTVTFSNTDLEIEIGETTQLVLYLSDSLNASTELIFTYQVGDSIGFEDEGRIISPLPNLTLYPGNKSRAVDIKGLNAGHVTVGVNSSSSQLKNSSKAFVRINTVHSAALVVVNAVIGWLYFAAWSVSFYPQVYINWRRKSVVGLNFDFLTYNITGFLAYSFFNVGMYWVAEVKNEYVSEHPRGINPVQLNDVIFTLHAVFVTLFTIGQCLIYERGTQKVSKVCMVLVAAAWLFAAIALIVTLTHKITWLTYLYYFSYIKLGVTLIKYIPQAYMNYQRKSTIGWSIGNVLLDFTGGTLSLLQMFLLSYNSDDWGSIFGDPTKFGLGLFSVLFDILFIVQHYCLYHGRDAYQALEEEKEINVSGKNKDYQATKYIF